MLFGGEHAAEANVDSIMSSIGSPAQGESHAALLANIYGSRREMEHLRGAENA